MKLLVVEDEALLRHHLQTRLTESGHVVEAVANAEEALYQTEQFNHDLAMIDLGLPGLGGLELIRQLRARGKTFPILILTARGNWQDKVEGLAAGADDYVVKPVDLHELAARLRALVRRAHGQPQECLSAQDVVLDPASRSVRQAGVPVTLSTREFDLLQAFMLGADRVLSREQLEQQLYSWGQEVESNAIEVHIHNLRRKLGPALIHTVRGVGYMLQRDVPKP